MHTLCKLTEDVIAAMVPQGNSLKTAINLSEDFGLEVSRRAVQIYERVDQGDEVLSVLKSDTNELVVWGAKEAAKQAGYGRAAAAVSALEDIANHLKTVDEAANYKAEVEQQLRNLEILINQHQYDMMLQRQHLVAVEALKDAVIAACNSGQPVQASPVFAGGADAYLPVQNTSGSADPVNTPWWANLGAINIPLHATHSTARTTTSTRVAPTGSASPNSTDGACASGCRNPPR
jgi:hypothetical protein